MKRRSVHEEDSTTHSRGARKAKRPLGQGFTEEERESEEGNKGARQNQCYLSTAQ